MERVTENVTDQVTRAKAFVDDVIENGQHKVERTFKRAVVSAEDCIEDTTHLIKKHPWGSVGVAIGLSAFVGILAGWQAGRCCERYYAG